MRTLKEACLWLQEWSHSCVLMTAIESGMASYTDHYVHLDLGYKPLRQFERED
jgi:hypothetical protein